ncbi:metal ABC transporter permease [Candidatus Albibeggiatoa sp. nov. NOAA]|uniref:metal ABC transporter permease n=1 Tax=Candidatus Albibeggiatoa sp. nov. NOAA TaxID=3162724 RepID=UPI00330330BF|nr:metal ABC transporter permease [Thiotrichaceae bacterium]
MSTFLDALWQFSFLQHAMLAGLLASIGCGVIGSYVVVKRITFLAGGIAHAVLGGMGIAYYFQQPVLAGALIAALGTALFIGWIYLHSHQNEDTLIGAVWATGMAIGILFISQTPGYNVDLMSYLFGNILMVSRTDLYLMAGLDAIIVLTVIIFYKQLLITCFDEEFAQLRNISVTFFYLLLLCMVALTVVLLIRVVGLILVIALLTLPAAIALQYAISLSYIMLVASVLGMVFTSTGLGIAYEYNLPAGASIILVAAASYFVSTIFIQSILKKWRSQT